MNRKRGRPKLSDRDKKKLISIKLHPSLLNAIEKLGGKRTALIEAAIIKTYNLKIER